MQQHDLIQGPTLSVCVGGTAALSSKQCSGFGISMPAGLQDAPWKRSCYGYDLPSLLQKIISLLLTSLKQCLLFGSLCADNLYSQSLGMLDSTLF